MQRTILSQWFLFLVPDLNISRLHIVSVVCVSGALVDLEFPFPFFPFFLSLSLSHLSLFATFSFFFFPSCFFSFLSINPFHLHAAAFAELHTKLSFSLLFTANLDWTFRFDKKSKHSLIILTSFPFCLFLLLLFTHLAACSGNAVFFLSPNSIARPTKHSKSLCGVEHAPLLPVDLQANIHY